MSRGAAKSRRRKLLAGVIPSRLSGSARENLQLIGRETGLVSGGALNHLQTG